MQLNRFTHRLTCRLFDKRGELTPGGEAPPAAPQNGGAWYAPAESLRTSDPATWQSFERHVEGSQIKDMAGFVKDAISLRSKMGTALVPPGKDAKPEEVSAFRHKVNGGPGAADKYSFDKIT